MSDCLLESKGLLASGPESQEPRSAAWAGPALRSTLLFLAAPAALAVAIAVLDLRLPSAVLYAIAVVLGLVLFVRSLFDPEWLLAVAILYIPLNKVYAILILPGINATNLLAFLLLFCWLIRAMSEGQPFFRSLPNSRLVAAFAILTTLSGVTAILTFGRVFLLETQVGEYWAWIILFFAFLNLIRDGNMARRMVVYMMLGMLVVMLMGAREWLDKQGLDSIEKSRVFGPQKQPNDFGAFLVYASAPFVALFVTFMSKIRTWALLPFLALLAKLLLVTFSRAAYIAMALLGLATGYLRGKLFLLGWGIFAAAMLVAMPELIPDSLVDRMSQTTEPTGTYGEMDTSSENRIVLWEAALEMTFESPIFGKGFKAFPALKSQYTAVSVRETDNHNMYLYISSQMGIPALILFLAILYRMYRLGSNLYRMGKEPFMRAIGMGAAGMVPGILAINMFGSRVVSIDCVGYVWIYLAVLAHLWIEQEQRAASGERRDVTP
jgi:O-antigen ligase